MDSVKELEIVFFVLFVFCFCFFFVFIFLGVGLKQILQHWPSYRKTLIIAKIVNFRFFRDLRQCRSKGNISGGARERWRPEPLGGCGGMLPQKILKSRGLEMLFPAFFKSYL